MVPILLGVAAIVWEIMNKPTGPVAPTLTEKLAFVSRMRAIARRVESVGAVDIYTGANVPPGVKADFGIAQLAVESAYGTSQLAREAHNLSGLTADPDAGTYWTRKGFPVYTIETTERNADHSEYRKVRAFRRYRSEEESYIDWARLIYSLYPESFAAAQTGDFAAFAAGLQQRGYALNDNLYATKVLRFGAEIGRIA